MGSLRSEETMLARARGVVKGLSGGVGLMATLSILLLLVACEKATTPPPAVTPVPTSDVITAPTALPLTGPAEDGRILFSEKGCSACHGQDAKGTDIAPALPGHSGAIVKRQVRAPIGMMPVFPPDKISNVELDAIAAYVESIPGGHAHRPAGGVGQDVAQHHWMTLFALAEEDVVEAGHHVQHIIDLVAGDHRARMRHVLAALEQGDLHDAEHTVEGMLAGTAQPDLTTGVMHLQMALSSLRVDKRDDAIHHMGHFAQVDVTEGSSAQGEAIISWLRDGDFLEAEHALEQMLGAGEDSEEADEHEDGTTEEAH